MDPQHYTALQFALMIAPAAVGLALPFLSSVGRNRRMQEQREADRPQAPHIRPLTGRLCRDGKSTVRQGQAIQRAAMRAEDACGLERLAQREAMRDVERKREPFPWYDGENADPGEPWRAGQ